MRLKRYFLTPFILLASLNPAHAKAPDPASIEPDIKQCQADPRFKVGGAAMGDCLLEISAKLDQEIKAAMKLGEKRYCLAEDTNDFKRSHADWQAYRQRLCDLVERSPDNTPSWVNAAACRLELGRQRLVSMRYTNEYGSTRCHLQQPQNTHPR